LVITDDQGFDHAFRPEDLGELRDCTIGRNVYFSAGAADTAAGPFLAALLARGHDRRSVYADPLFEDWEGGDFRLRPDSPALALGITPIDLTNVGIRENRPRRKTG